MKVTVATDRTNKRYLVRVESGEVAHLRHNREYLWGMFDDGDIHWQRARADAWAYADQLSQRLQCRWHVV